MPPKGKKKTNKKKKNKNKIKNNNKINENQENKIQEAQAEAEAHLKKLTLEEKGEDSNGQKFDSLHQMWQEIFLEKSSEENLSLEGTEISRELLDTRWYSKASVHWKDVESSVDGMLGGYGHISVEDSKGSSTFLKGFLDGTNGIQIQKRRALDCGAGIGRITKHVLSRFFERVDLLEQNQVFLDYAKSTYLQNLTCIDQLICSPLQTWNSNESNRYDCIWIQWVLIYLYDRDLIDFILACKRSLTADGIIVVKENITREGFVLDRVDASVTRSNEHLRALFEACGLKVVKEKLQTKFPKELFLVKMYALRPV